MKYLLILLCGGAGSLARYLASTAIATRFGARFPVVGTMTINITGCFNGTSTGGNHISL